MFRRPGFCLTIGMIIATLTVPFLFDHTVTADTLDLPVNIHLTWQSNRDKSWNIFYACSVDNNIPFRYETQITNTDSNSLSPDVASDIDGRRMVVWHDDRDGDFSIYSARALESEISANEECENNGILQYVTDDAAQFISFSFNFTRDCELTGNAHFVIQFYGDNTLTQLVETVNSKLDQTGWTVDGVPMLSDGVPGTDTVRVEYTPNARVSNICGKLVYGKVKVIYK